MLFGPLDAKCRLKVIFNRLGVDAVRQHPAFVVIGAQSQLVLLISNYSPIFHAKSSVCFHVFASFQFLSFRNPLCAELLFIGLFLVNIVTLFLAAFADTHGMATAICWLYQEHERSPENKTYKYLGDAKLFAENCPVGSTPVLPRRN